MRQPLVTVGRAETPEGPLELRQRGPRDFLMTVAGRVLMTSAAHRSEEALARRACAPLATRAEPRVLVSGLGMGFTLRAALDALPAGARVVVAELNPVVVDWCRGPMRDLCSAVLDDPRVDVRTGDVAQVIAEAAASDRGRFDAIVLDLYEGPRISGQGPPDAVFGPAALRRARRALRPGGTFAVWTERPDPAFERALGHAGFGWERWREGKGGRFYAVYVATPAVAGATTAVPPSPIGPDRPPRLRRIRA